MRCWVDVFKANNYKYKRIVYTQKDLLNMQLL